MNPVSLGMEHCSTPAQTTNPILTRELVYTGITRAREWLTLVEAKRGILNDAVAREVIRVSGM